MDLKKRKGFLEETLRVFLLKWDYSLIEIRFLKSMFEMIF